MSVFNSISTPLLVCIFYLMAFLKKIKMSISTTTRSNDEYEEENDDDIEVKSTLA